MPNRQTDGYVKGLTLSERWCELTNEKKSLLYISIFMSKS